MKNADKPIYPLEFKKEGHFDKTDWSDGLTKREYFAVLAMQGMIANTDTYVQDKSVIAKLSIEHADELLKQLENEQ